MGSRSLALDSPSVWRRFRFEADQLSRRSDSGLLRGPSRLSVAQRSPSGQVRFASPIRAARKYRSLPVPALPRAE
jgi:hypothetical protein